MKGSLTCVYMSQRILGTLLNVKILLIDKTTLLQREANLRKRLELSHL